MSKVAKAAISLMLVTILSKILGFGRELALASSYGASSYSDAYLVALTIPTIIFTSIATALGTSFIPLFYDIREQNDEKNAMQFTNNLINVVIILCIVFIVLGLIFTQPLVKMFAVGFEGETLELTVKFTRILFPGIIFIGLNYIITSYLQIKENFIIPGLIGIPYNIIIIGSILLSVYFDVYILVYGTLLAMISQFLFQLPFAYKKGYKYKFHINIKDESMKKMICLVAPVFIGVSVNQINTLVDRTLASTLVEGSISALTYANRLNGFVMGLFISSIASVIYPMLSNLSAKNDKENFNNAIVKSINTIIILVIPISVGAIVLATPIVQILFQRGAFDYKATQMTASALVYFSIGMVAFGLRDILSRIFYSIQDTKTPMINGAIAVGFNIILNLILVRYMGHAGLALGTSISGLICIVLLFFSLRRKIGPFGERDIVVVLLKSLLASIIMGFITKISYNYLGLSEIINVTLSISIGAIAYGMMVIVFKVEEVNILLDKINKRNKKTKKIA